MAWARRTQEAIWYRDGGRCIYCGGEGDTVDHVLPVKYGGRAWRNNGVLACRSCNSRKGARLNIDMLTRGFFHLLTVGENIAWIDGNRNNLGSLQIPKSVKKRIRARTRRRLVIPPKRAETPSKIYTTKPFLPIKRCGPDDPGWVIYRRQVRRVYGVVPARHQGHRWFALRYKRGHVPRDATQAAFGPRGQRHVTAVLVRSDHCRPLNGAMP